MPRSLSIAAREEIELTAAGYPEVSPPARGGRSEPPLASTNRLALEGRVADGDWSRVGVYKLVEPDNRAGRSPRNGLADRRATAFLELRSKPIDPIDLERLAGLRFLRG